MTSGGGVIRLFIAAAVLVVSPRAAGMRGATLNLCDSDNVVIAQVVESSTSKSSHSSGWETEAQLEVLSIAQGPPLVSLHLRADGGAMGASYRRSEYSPLLVHRFRYLLFLFERDDSEQLYIAEFEFLPGPVPVPSEAEFRMFWRDACTKHHNRIFSLSQLVVSEQPLLVPLSMQPLATALVQEYKKRKAVATTPSPEEEAEALRERQPPSGSIEQPAGDGVQQDHSTQESP